MQRGPVGQLLLTVLGSRFLEYVLSASEEEVARRLHEPDFRLSSRQERALEELATLIRAVEGQHREQNIPWYLLLDVLGSVVPELGTSWAHATRQATGGSTRIPKLGSVVGTLLSEMAQDAYALFLLPTEDFIDASQHLLARPLFRHPNRQLLEETILKDSNLSRLFPESTDAAGPHGHTVRSTGSGGSVQLWTFPQQMIEAAWHLSSLSSPRNPPGLPDLIRGINRVLDLVSAGLEMRAAWIPVTIGFAGVLLPDSAELKTPLGRLRPVRESDLLLVPKSLRGGLTGTTWNGERVKIDYAVTSYWRGEFPTGLSRRRSETTPSGHTV